MVWRYLTLATMLVLGISGCEQQSSSRTAVAQPVLATAPAETPGDVVVIESDSAPVSDQPVAAIASKRSSEQDDSFIPPFPENVDFFSPPEIPAAEPEPVPEVVATESEAEAHSTETPLDLRVIGFVQVAGERPKAMLHLEGQLEVVAAGDEVGDLWVVEVNEPSVSVLRDGQQLQFALNENAATGSIAARNSQRNKPAQRRGAWSRTRDSGSNTGAETLPVPVDFDSLPGVPEPPSVDLPEIDLPDVPQLRTISE